MLEGRDSALTGAATLAIGEGGFVAVGAAPVDTTAGPAATATPHLPQNRSPGLTSAPHDGQKRAADAPGAGGTVRPQFPQNFWSGLSAVPQAVQVCPDSTYVGVPDPATDPIEAEEPSDPVETWSYSRWAPEVFTDF
jgi:hypothetical protein